MAQIMRTNILQSLLASGDSSHFQNWKHKEMEGKYCPLHKLEYLGFWITGNGIHPLVKKVEATQNLTAPKTHKELHRFIGLVNYY